MRGLVFLFVTLIGTQAYANNSFVPNFYKNRKELNHFAALGWSDRHEVEVNYFTESSAIDVDGVRSTDSTISGPKLQGYYRLPNKINFEIDGALTKTDSALSGYSTARSSQDSTSRGRFATGYEFANIPLALGASYQSLESNSTDTDHNTTTTRQERTELGVGYILPLDIYAGLGYENLHFKTGVIEYYSVGVGKVYGQKAAPTATTEVIFTYANRMNSQVSQLLARGLYNWNAFQFTGEATYYRYQNTDAKYYEVKGGVDYEFFSFYAGPQINYAWNASDDRGRNATSSKDFSPSLQAGYRTQWLEAYLSYASDRNLRVFGFDTIENNMNRYAAGLIYKF